MSHTIKDKQKLILRAKRIQGQVEALVRVLTEERLLRGSASDERGERGHEQLDGRTAGGPHKESCAKRKAEAHFTAGDGRRRSDRHGQVLFEIAIPSYRRNDHMSAPQSANKMSTTASPSLKALSPTK